MNEEDQKTHEKGVGDVARFFWRYLRHQKFLAAGILFFGALAMVLQNVIAPIWYKKFVDAVTHVTTFTDATRTLTVILLTAVGIRLLGILLGNVKFRLNIRFQPRVMQEIQNDVMASTLRHSYRFFSDTFSGTLTRKLGRLTGTFEQLADLLMTTVWGVLFSLGGILFVLFQRYVTAAVIVLAWIIIYSVIKGFYVRSKIRSHHEFSRLDAVAMGIMSDVFSNATTVKLFARESDEVEHFVNADMLATSFLKKHWMMTANMDAVDAFLNALLECLVLGFMIRGLVAGTLSIGDVVLLQSFLLVIFGQLSGISWTMRRILELTGDVQEVLEIIEKPIDIVDAPHARDLRVTGGSIVFDRVDFTYNSKHVFEDLSFQILPKEKVAFVGSSGAGKTTITRLILRFFDVQGGRVLIDGQDISKVTQHSLRTQVGFVPQEPLLFHRSLRDNIAYGHPDAKEKEIIAAAKKAHCHEFISSLEKGYDTLVGERGIKLSGGERQRVAIARAILKNSPILVLDEATSSLDSESESLIQDALRQLMKDKTVIVIAHRLSTIMQMDRIIVMENGKVTDMGTHTELLKKVGIYQKLWNIQAGGFQST